MIKMKTYSRIFFGIILLLAAAALIVLAFFPHLALFFDIPVWKLILCVLLLYLIIAQFCRKSSVRNKFLIFVKLSCIFFLLKPTIFGYMGITSNVVSNWVILVAAILIDLAIILLFKKNRVNVTSDHASETNAGITGGNNFSSTFSNRVYYLDATKQKHFVSSTFGNMTVFFKNTDVDAPGTDISLFVENKFGQTDITVPSTWNVVSNIEYSFGEVVNSCTEPTFPGKTLNIAGNCRFGNVTIHR